MKILIIEDTLSKKEAIISIINSRFQGSLNRPIIICAENLQHARRELYTNIFDLVIFDMYLPVSSGEKEQDCSQELILEFSQSKNYQTEAIALTQFEISEIEDIKSFNSAGITLVKYTELSEHWKIALLQKMERAGQKIKYDFLIFCALIKERKAYEDADCIIGETKNIFGMNCIEVQIDSFIGLIIKPNNMGLVNMAIIASKAIELFQPKIVATSGICAGIEGESNYLDIIVGDICWEYQTGKWKDGEFLQEPYQVSLHNSLKVDLEQSSESIDILSAIRKDLYNTYLGNMQIKIAPISSGSAVIADNARIMQIIGQQRKMAALEMEMYSLYEAAKQSLCSPLFFGAKAVVDMGDKNKNDDLHKIGCCISARYVLLIIKEQLLKNSH